MFYSLAQLRQIESQAASAGIALMPRAGLAIAQFIATRFGPVARLCFLAGPGNNGGDALQAASYLREQGFTQISVCLFTDPRTLPHPARQAHADWLASGGSCQDQLPNARPTLIIDGLFGIGLNRPLAASWQDLIGKVNQLAAPVLAIDLPSGVLADSGSVPNQAIQSHWTLSLLGRSCATATGAALDHVGEVHCANLDLPAEFYPAPLAHNSAALVQKHALARPRDSHKGRFGCLGIIGGAPGMVGAPLLAGRAALHGGAGKVKLALLDPRGPAFDPLRPELMVGFDYAALIQEADVLLLGPGLGLSRTALSALRLALSCDKPLVLDADALNLLARQPRLAALLQGRTAPCILTPHPAEAARLLQTSTPAIQNGRLQAARQLSHNYHATVLLKGAGSIIANGAQLAINSSGSAAMANAGQGDVLAGLIAALLAQRVDPWLAANWGTYAHGAASDRLVQRNGVLVTLADEVASEVGKVLGAMC